MTDSTRRGPVDAAAGWLNWRTAVMLSIAVCLLRLIYLAFISPYGLVADEAHYWEWSRRLALSYYTKGPGIAWLIAGGTALFGNTEFGVRALAPVANLITALGIGAIAWRIFPQREQVAFYAMVGFHLVIGYAGTAMLMTIDGPYMACWAWATWAGVMLCQNITRNRSTLRLGTWAFAFGLIIGIGVLFKYTILLVLLGALIGLFHEMMRRRRTSLESDEQEIQGETAAAPQTQTPPASGNAANATGNGMTRLQRGWLGVMLGVMLGVGLGVLLGVLPVVIWNVQHDWATVKHLMGHLGVEGGDVAVDRDAHYSPMWLVRFFVEQLGFVGPTLWVLILWAAVRCWRGMGEAAGGRIAWWVGMVILLFYGLLTFQTPVTGNWPIAGYVSLLVFMGFWVAERMEDRRLRLAQWHALDEPRPKWGLFKRSPENVTQILWHWSVGIGIGANVVILTLPIWAMLPVVGEVVPMYRLQSGMTLAAGVQPQWDALRADSPEAFMVTDDYEPAGWLAFYLEAQPVVRCAEHVMGGRPSAYDFFADTALDDPQLRGRDALLVGETPERWASVMRFERIEPAGAVSVGDPHDEDPDITPIYIGYGYGGLTKQAAAARNPATR